MMKDIFDILPTEFILETNCDTGLTVSGIHYDSRKIKENHIFFAIPGETVNGEKYITQAMENGAVAIVICEKSEYNNPQIPFFKVKNIRQVMALSAASFYDHAADELKLIGVTGTNGKTTITHILYHLLEKNHYKPAMIGTIEYRFDGKSVPAVRTTPESLDLHKYFYDIYVSGHKSVVMEVSSHALALSRTYGLNFNVAIFTNLSRDHLDFHQNEKNYFNAKALLFKNRSKLFKAVINIDDPYGRRLAELSDGELFTYGINNPNAQIRIKSADYKIEGTFLKVITPLGEMNIISPLIGKFNVYNILASVGVGVCLGMTFDDITQSLQNLGQVPGRCEKISLPNSGIAVIDYAHTPDALQNICEVLRQLSNNRLYIVFGAGGDRDQGKRQLMGKVAQDYGDIVFITSDNPRGEEPDRIIEDILSGISDRSKVVVERNRQKAIHRALDMAIRGDIILIAGKGHENYQEIKGKKYPFDDAQVVRTWIMDGQ